MKEISRILLLLAVFETLLWFQPIVEAKTDGLQEFLQQNAKVFQQAEKASSVHEQIDEQQKRIQSEEANDISQHEQAMEAVRQLWRSAKEAGNVQMAARGQAHIQRALHRSVLSAYGDENTLEVR